MTDSRLFRRFAGKAALYASGLFCLCLCAVSLQAQHLLYAKSFNNSHPIGGDVVSKSVKTDRTGNTYVTGYFTATADFDPGPGTAMLTAHAGGNDIFFAKYDASGNYVYAKSIGGTTPAYANDMAVDGSGNVYITGYYAGTTDFDPGTGTANLTSNTQSNDIFFAKYTAAGNLVYANSISGTGSDAGNGIAVDDIGSVYLTGYFVGTADFDPSVRTANLTSAGSNDIFFAKYNTSGTYLFAKRIGGASGDVSNGISAADGTGNMYITGSFAGTADFDPGAGTVNLVSAGGNDIFVARYNGAGDLVFAKSIGGTGGDIGNGIAVDATGNVYITGAFSVTADFDPGAGTASLASKGSTDVFVARYDASGNYGYAGSMGGTRADVAYHIVLDAAQHAYITGSFSGTADFDPGTGVAELTSTNTTTDVFVAGYDQSGAYNFAKVLGGSGTDTGFGIAGDASGRLLVTGSFTQTADVDPGNGTNSITAPGTLTNAFLVYLNNQGTYVMSSQFGTYPSEAYYETGQSIAVDALSNTYITGSFSGSVDFDPGTGTAYLTSAGNTDIFIAKYDASGNFVFAISIGSTNGESGMDIAVDGKGNIYIIGSFSGNSYNGALDFDPGEGTAILNSKGVQDIFFAKYDAAGNYLYAKALGNIDNDYGRSIAVDGTGNAYITGSFKGTADFDQGPGTYNITSNRFSDDIFIAKYDASGNFIFAKAIGDVGGDGGDDILVDLSGNIYVTGNFSGIANFNPGGMAVTLTSVGLLDMFFAKYDPTGILLFAKSVGGTSHDYGNGIAIDKMGNIYLTGSFSGQADFDPDEGVAILKTAQSSSNMFIAAYDASGHYIYAKDAEGSNTSHGSGIAADPAGNIYVTGSFSGTIDFDPDAGTANLTSMAYNSDFFIAKYDASGNYVYAKGIGGVDGDYSFGIALDGMQNAYITGYFSGTAMFDPGSTAPGSTLKASNMSDIFIAKFGPLNSLPVELKSFIAKLVSNTRAVQVSWSTASETNNAYFEVERSTDGQHFASIGRVQGCTACTADRQYLFSDNDPYNGIAYYRLKQVDINGRVTYSAIAQVTVADDPHSAFRVYPNVTSDAYAVVINNGVQQKQALIRLLNASGTMIREYQVSLEKGTNNFRYSLGGQASGLYFIQVVDKTTDLTRILRIIKP